MFFFSYAQTWAQQNDFINIVNSGTITLNTSQMDKYQVAIDNPLYDSDYIVTLGELATLQDEGIIEFQLPGKSCLITAGTNVIEYTDANNFSWSANVVPNDQTGYECQEGNLFLLRKDGKYIGRFSVDEDVYILEDIGGGKQVLIKIDFTKEELICNVGEDDLGDSSEEESQVENRSTDVCPVTALAVYTDKAEASVPDIELTIRQSIANTNFALNNSKVKFKIDLLDVIKVGFNNDEDTVGIREEIQAVLDDSEIQFLREDSQADIVLVYTNGYYGRIIGNAAEIGPSVDSAFAIIRAPFALVGGTTEHEIGHLFGCRHQSPPDRTETYAHAHQMKFRNNVVKNTVMWSVIVSKVPYFSNPNILYYGKPTGIVNEADNAKKLRNSNCVVSEYGEDDSRINGYIMGDDAVCNGENVYATADIWGGTGIYNYEWTYSYDGFNYENLLSNNHSVWIPGVDKPIGAVGIFPIHIRLTVTDQNNKSVTLFKTVHSSSSNHIGQEIFPCPDVPIYLPGNGATNTTFNVYPNPVRDILTIKLIGDEVGETVKIYDVSGVLVLTKRYNESIDVSKLEPGSYIVKLISDNEEYNSRFIKL